MTRIAIVGGGIRGRLFAGALADVPGVSLAGFAEPSPNAREALRKQFDLPIYPDHDSLLAAGADAVIIATPDFAHTQAAIAAAKAGAALLIEKPLATSSADAGAIREAVEAAGVGCLVGFENRWNPHFIQLHDTIAAGSLGAIVRQSATLSNTTYVPLTMLPWAARSSPSWFLLPHLMDLALWLGSRPVGRVTATARAGVLRAKGIDTWDTVDATVEFTDGSSAALSCAWILPPATPGIVAFDYNVLGERGSARAQLDDQGLTIATDALTRPWPLGGSIGGEVVGPAVWMVRDWVRMVQGRAEWGPGVRHGELVTAVIEAVHLAIAERRWVELP